MAQALELTKECRSLWPGLVVVVEGRNLEAGCRNLEEECRNLGAESRPAPVRPSGRGEAGIDSSFN
eukprot:7191185-Heterocapsa_arctica.AAC.1